MFNLINVGHYIVDYDWETRWWNGGGNLGK